jgi:hypothetical protein
MKSYKTLQAAARKIQMFQNKIRGMGVVQAELSSPWTATKAPSAAAARASAAARAARKTSISEGVSDMPKTYHRGAD